MDCQREAKTLEFTQGTLAQLTGGTGTSAVGTGFSRVGYVVCVDNRCYKSVVKQYLSGHCRM